jgi:hypothetical protein
LGEGKIPFLKLIFKPKEYQKEHDIKDHSSVINSTNLPFVFQFPLATYISSHLNVENPPNLPVPAGRFDNGVRLGNLDVFLHNKELFISEKDLYTHLYVIGKTGSGKSTMIKSMIAGAIELDNQAVFVLDPHGDLVADIINWMPKEHAKRTIYIDFSNSERFAGLNILEANDQKEMEFAIGELDNFFLRTYGPEIWGPRIQDVFRNLAKIIGLDHDKEGTLLDFIWALDFDKTNVLEYLQKIARENNLITAEFFFEQILSCTSREGSLSELKPYFRAKFSPLVDNFYLRNIIGQKQSTLDFKKFVSEKKICLFNLSKGMLSSRYSSLIGTILTIKIFQTAISSSNLNINQRPPMILFLDEFQNFVSDTLEDILSEARKFKLSMVLANQFLDQLSSKSFNISQSDMGSRILSAILGNVGSIVSFRLSGKDAEIIANEFGHNITPNQISGLPNWHAIAKISQNGCSLPPFTFRTNVLGKNENPKIAKWIKEKSELEYCRSKLEIEQGINERLAKFL